MDLGGLETMNREVSVKGRIGILTETGERLVCYQARYEPL